MAFVAVVTEVISSRSNTPVSGLWDVTGVNGGPNPADPPGQWDVTDVTTGRSQAPRMFISTVDLKYTFTSKIAPVNVTYSGYGYTWSEAPRAGKTPLLLMESWMLPKISFTMTYADQYNPDWDCTEGLRTLAYMTGQMSPVTIRYGSYFENNAQWRITNYNFNSTRRHPVTDAITSAEIDLEFTMANDVVLNTGPVSGGVK